MRLIIIILITPLIGYNQVDSYQFDLNLNKVKNDMLQITLTPPKYKALFKAVYL